MRKVRFFIVYAQFKYFYAFVLKYGRGLVILTKVYDLCVSAESENEDTPLSSPPPQFLKTKKMYTYSGINKYTGKVYVFKE